MKNITFKILLVGMLVLFPTFLFGGEVYDAVTFYGYTEENVDIAWDADPENSIDQVTQHEVEMHHVEHKAKIVVGKATHPTQTMTLVFPRSGHYVVKVRSCHDVENPDTGEMEYTCSEWTESLNAERSQVWNEAEQQYKARAWWVYRTVSPPGGIGIE